MRRLQFKFLSQIRISGWDFGSSARAMNQAGGKDSLMTYELVREAGSTQADLEKVSRSTTERKSMSTKTTIKRIALVAVSALGLGVLTSVVPASANTTLTTEYVTSIAAVADIAPVAGANATQTNYTLYFKSSTTSTSQKYQPKVILASAPATSALAEASSYAATTAAAKWQLTTASGGTTKSTAADQTLGTVTASVNGTYAYGVQYLSVRYDVPGTYTWTVFNDMNNNGYVDGSEYSTTLTAVVAGPGATAIKATATAINSTSSTSGTARGSLVKITLTDAAGNPANVDAAGGIKITMSGSAKVSYVNNTDVTDAATYTLGAGAFDGSGNAWVNVIDGTAETATLTLSGVGDDASTFTAPAALALTYKATCTTSCATTLVGGTSTTNTISQVVYATSGASVTAAFSTGYATDATSTNAGIIVEVTDTSGKITGYAGGVYDIVVAGSSTATTPDIGAFSITSAFTAASQTYSLQPGGATGTVAGGTSYTVTSTAQALTTITATTTDGASTAYKSATGATQSFLVTAKDQFGAGMANVTVTPSITGRNSTLVLATFVTGASGKSTWTYTDASTSTTSLTDTVSFASGSVTVTTAPVVTYTAAANYGASTISLVTPSETTAGTINSPAIYSEIGTGALADGAQAGVVTVTATVKDANGVVMAGVPVTFSVAGTGAAILSTKKVVVTGSTGTAASSLYAWVSGTYKVTATVGTISDDATSMWRNTSSTSARVVSATVNGSDVVAKVVDRFGNPVYNVPLTATRVGTGSFSGSSTSQANTGYDGTVTFVLTGGSADVTVATTTAGYGQTLATLGQYDNVAGDTYTAYVAGTSTTAEVGVGSTYAPAGVGSVVASGVSNTSASDSVDAANEATDAANAATDAANAAAEAADAATAAAQDAQAAVAALASQVADLISGIKAQITALTNLVIKIQKKVKA